MPTIAKALDPANTVHTIVARAPSPYPLFPANDIKLFLSDALLSLSPLVTLVGAESARALVDRATNFKQSLFACIAPIGALGMMATVAKGSSLTGVKEMLGVGRHDIRDAARDLGCAAIAGDVIPRMDENGCVVSVGTGFTLEQAACAVVRQKWKTGGRKSSGHHLDLDSLRRVPATFVAGTMSGRLTWETDSQEETMDTIRKVQNALLSTSSANPNRDVFDTMNQGGFGKKIKHIRLYFFLRTSEGQPTDRTWELYAKYSIYCLI